MQTAIRITDATALIAAILTCIVLVRALHQFLITGQRAHQRYLDLTQAEANRLAARRRYARAREEAVRHRQTLAPERPASRPPMTALPPTAAESRVLADHQRRSPGRPPGNWAGVVVIIATALLATSILAACAPHAGLVPAPHPGTPPHPTVTITVCSHATRPGAC